MPVSYPLLLWTLIPRLPSQVTGHCFPVPLSQGFGGMLILVGFFLPRKKGFKKIFFIVRLLIGLTLNPEGLFNRMYLSASGLISRTLLI